MCSDSTVSNSSYEDCTLLRKRPTQKESYAPNAELHLCVESSRKVAGEGAALLVNEAKSTKLEDLNRLAKTVSEKVQELEVISVNLEILSSSSDQIHDGSIYFWLFESIFYRCFQVRLKGEQSTVVYQRLSILERRTAVSYAMIKCSNNAIVYISIFFAMMLALLMLRDGVRDHHRRLTFWWWYLVNKCDFFIYPIVAI